MRTSYRVLPAARQIEKPHRRKKLVGEQCPTKEEKMFHLQFWTLEEKSSVLEIEIATKKADNFSKQSLQEGLPCFYCLLIRRRQGVRVLKTQVKLRTIRTRLRNSGKFFQ